MELARHVFETSVFQGRLSTVAAWVRRSFRFEAKLRETFSLSDQADEFVRLVRSETVDFTCE
jgi:hypothetical protein